VSAFTSRIDRCWRTVGHALRGISVVAVPTVTVAVVFEDHTALALLAAPILVCLSATVHLRNYRQLHLLRAELRAARRDPMTGLPTRGAGDAFVASVQHAAGTLTAALADVDGLHAINSNLGHAAGDTYLVTIATRLAGAVPPGGCLVRHGCDEFMILAPDTDADDLATAIGAAMAGPAVIAGHRIQPRASVGIATGPAGDTAHIRACADAAMYTAKAAGGNHVRVYRPDRDGQPHPDGTRPIIRRRDLNPTGDNDVAWTPTPGDDLLPFLFTIDDARTVAHALRCAHDCSTHTTTVTAVHPHTEPGSDREPGTARLNAAPQRTRYDEIAARMTPIITAAQQTDTHQPPRPSISPAGGAGTRGPS